MEHIVEKSMLFDFYGELLTVHQRNVYEEYVHNDLSVSELAAILGISRQGAYDMIRRCEKILNDYESRLHLVAHYMKVKKMVGMIHSYSEDILGSEDKEQIRDRITKISEISNNILEEY